MTQEDFEDMADGFMRFTVGLIVWGMVAAFWAALLLGLWLTGAFIVGRI